MVPVSIDVQAAFSALNIGHRVRQLRLKRGLTLKDVSGATGLSKPLLSQLENNISAPPIATLLKISEALDVDICEFFQGPEAARGIAPVRAAAGMKRIRRRGDDDAAVAEYRYQSLAHPFSLKQMAPFLVEIEPRDPSRMVYFQHRGEAFIFVLKGQVAFHCAEKTMSPDTAGSPYFDSGIAHALRRVGAATARVLGVVYTPDQL